MDDIAAIVIDDFVIAGERFLFIWNERERRKSGFEVPVDAELSLGDKLILTPTGEPGTYHVVRVEDVEPQSAPRVAGPQHDRLGIGAPAGSGQPLTAVLS